MEATVQFVGLVVCVLMSQLFMGFGLLIILILSVQRHRNFSSVSSCFDCSSVIVIVTRYGCNGKNDF